MKYDVNNKKSFKFPNGEEGVLWVFLDGNYVFYAQRFDTEDGWVEAPLIDRLGKPVFDYMADEWAIEKRSGLVQVLVLRNAYKETSKEIAKVIAGNPFLIADDDPRGLKKENVT